MKITTFITLVRKHEKDKRMILNLFMESFFNAAREAAKVIPDDGQKFVTKTWLLTSKWIHYLEGQGIRIEQFNYPKRLRVILAFTACIAYGNDSEWKKIMKRPFYKIYWTKDDLEKLKHFLYK